MAFNKGNKAAAVIVVMLQLKAFIFLEFKTDSAGQID